MKKLILIALFSLTSTIALATSIQMPSYNRFMSIAPETVQFAPLCPDGVTCVVNGTSIQLDYTYSCAADMISFTYEAKEIGAELHVFVSAIVGTNFTNGPVCQAFTHQTQEIQLINMYGEVVIHNLGVQEISINEGPQ